MDPWVAAEGGGIVITRQVSAKLDERQRFIINVLEKKRDIKPVTLKDQNLVSEIITSFLMRSSTISFHRLLMVWVLLALLLRPAAASEASLTPVCARGQRVS